MSMLIVHELHEARDRVLLLIDLLRSAMKEELREYQDFLSQQIKALDEAILQAEIPERYRVAVVGRFKVGKSRFVNQLTGEQLAGVNSNPETAAISVLRYDTDACAEVEMISFEEWNKLAISHSEDPQNPEVTRYDRFIKFNDRAKRKDKTGNVSLKPEYDLDGLIQRWVVPGGSTHKIVAQNWGTKEGKKAFKSEIRKFTSSQEPIQYLVNKLTISAPIPILRDQIELVDTPGLDDTEKFRVVLTEELVKDVDAILFLTTSGGSYSQSDKEFIIRQLRRRQIKHLQLIVTKSDETFENAVRDAKENDEDPPSFDQFRDRQIQRVRAESQETLNELLQSNQLSDEDGFYFIEQLDDVPVHLISSKFQEDGDSVKGGFDAVRDGLFKILSTSNRFEHARTTLVDRVSKSLMQLRKMFGERLSTLESEYDPAKVTKEIEAIRALLSERLNAFGERSGEAVSLLAKDQEAFFELLPTHLDSIIMRAKEVLNEFEKADLILHWRSRRHGNWGCFSDLKNRVADRIFPSVELLLKKLDNSFETFMRHMEGFVVNLQIALSEIEVDHNLSGLAALDLAGNLNPVFNDIRDNISYAIGNLFDGIVSNLDDFVTEEVRDQLDVAKESISEIEGKGTVRLQDRKVEEFYSRVRLALTQSLEAYLEDRIGQFASALKSIGESLLPRIHEDSNLVLSQRLAAIESSLKIAKSGQKEGVKSYLGTMVDKLSRFGDDPFSKSYCFTSSVQRSVDAGVQKSEVSDDSTDVCSDSLQERRYEIEDGATGFTYEAIFRPYIDSASTIFIEEPYIRKPHQVDNLLRFCALAVRLGSVKTIELVTGEDFEITADDVYSKLETLRRDLSIRNISFEWSRDSKIHDRVVRFDNGWTIEVGRGLDIYYPPESRVSVSAADFGLRRCRKTKVNVYRHE